MKLAIIAFLVRDVVSQGFFSSSQCGSHTGYGRCNAAKACTWCSAGAAQGGCYAISFAKGLPRGALTCASISEGGMQTAGRSGDLAQSPSRTPLDDKGDDAGLRLGRRTLGALLGVSALTAPLGRLSWAAAESTDIKLDIFTPDPGSSLFHPWRELDDAIGSGKSKGTTEVTRSFADGKLVWDGEVKKGPEGTPMYLLTRTVDQPKIRGRIFPNMSKCEGISLIAKSTTPYKGFSFFFAGTDERAVTLEKYGMQRGAYGLKAKLEVPEKDFGVVQIPFKDFVDVSDGTPCRENPERCQGAIGGMTTMSLIAEGEEGKVHVEVKEISAYGCGQDPALLASVDEIRFRSPWICVASIGLFMLVFTARSRAKSIVTVRPLLG